MKKVKLFTTIASLCLAVALMAFGVYAATVTDLKVSGTINFTSTAIDGSWTFKEASVTGAKFAGDVAKVTSITGNKLPDITLTATSQEVVITIIATFTNTSTTDAVLSATGTEAEGVTYSNPSNVTGEDKATNGGVTDVTITVKWTTPTAAEQNASVDYEVTFHAEAPQG